MPRLPRKKGRLLTSEAELVPILSVKPHPKNPNRGDLNVVSDSVATHGFYGAIVAQKSTRQIIAGETRWRAAQAGGLTEVPVMFADVDDEEAERIMLADNRLRDLAGVDDAALQLLLEEIAQTSAGLDGTGYGLEDLIENEKPQVRSINVSKPPAMTWALIGLPTVRYGEIAERVQELAQVDGVVSEIVSNNADG